MKRYRLPNYAISTDQHRVSPLRRFCRIGLLGLARKRRDAALLNQKSEHGKGFRNGFKERERIKAHARWSNHHHVVPVVPDVNYNLYNLYNINDLNHHINRSSHHLHHGGRHKYDCTVT